MDDVFMVVYQVIQRFQTVVSIAGDIDLHFARLARFWAKSLQLADKSQIRSPGDGKLF